MPQLNPTPWFFIFMMVWITLIMLLTKIIFNKNPSLPVQQISTPNINFWIWPWP
uniref:ATP synthase complex subunit 8 n=1 Tax=Acanthodactylus guineensis TaxID=1855261 RepID=A0A8A3WMD9_9SAUR|nr:ATP synthase F0 subunit 8 [Acanthodactylus guineensis]QTA72685.1 ATP synthase F0 subunit 8 [Acanthodactylus guineensis]